MNVQVRMEEDLKVLVTMNYSLATICRKRSFDNFRYMYRLRTSDDASGSIPNGWATKVPKVILGQANLPIKANHKLGYTIISN